jgi:hypothetical protein
VLIDGRNLLGKKTGAWFLLAGPLGNRGRSSATPARPSGAAPKGLGTARFFLGTRIEEAQERALPAASGGAGAAPPPKTTAPASWRLTLPWVSPVWGGLVGGRGHRKGQLRVLGSPSALRTKGGTQDQGATADPDPVCFCASPLTHWYIPEGTKAGLWATSNKHHASRSWGSEGGGGGGVLNKFEQANCQKLRKNVPPPSPNAGEGNAADGPRWLDNEGSRRVEIHGGGLTTRLS